METAVQASFGLVALEVYAALYLAGGRPEAAGAATVALVTGSAALLLSVARLGGARRPEIMALVAICVWVLPSACLMAWTGRPAALTRAGFAIPLGFLAVAKTAGMVLLLVLPASICSARASRAQRWRAGAWYLAVAGILVWSVETLWRGPEGTDELAFGLGFGALAFLIRAGVSAWLAWPLALLGLLTWAVPSVLFGLLYPDAQVAAIFSPLPLAPVMVPPLLLAAASRGVWRGFRAWQVRRRPPALGLPIELGSA